MREYVGPAACARVKRNKQGTRLRIVPILLGREQLSFRCHWIDIADPSWASVGPNETPWRFFLLRFGRHQAGDAERGGGR
jgi:hypothetical protein